MKKTYSIIFIAAMFFITIFLLCSLNISGTLSKENRFLEKFPELPSSYSNIKSFSDNFERWLKDRIGFRDDMIDFHRNILFHIFNQLGNDRVALGKNGTVFIHDIGIQDLPRYDIIRHAFQVSDNYENSVRAQLAVLLADMELVKHSKVPVLFIAIPASPVFRYEDMPDFLKKSVPQKFRETLPVEAAFELLQKYFPDISHAFIYPLDIGRKLNREHPVYPEKNFHWSVSPFSEAVAKIVAEKLNLPPLSENLVFHKCETRAELSQLAGREMTNYNDICFDPKAYSKIKTLYWNNKDFPLRKLSDIPIIITKNPERKNNTLIIGDSFGHTLQKVLSRYFGETLYLDYHALIRKCNNNNNDLIKYITLIKKSYKYESIIVICHDTFLHVTKDSPLTILFD